MGVGHAQAFGFGIHDLRKTFFAATDGFGQGNGGIIARLHNQAFKQIVDTGRFFGVQKHA
jgi:hypothetical protein